MAFCVTRGFLWLWIGRSSGPSRPRWLKLAPSDPRKKTCQSVSALLESCALLPHFTSQLCIGWPTVLLDLLKWFSPRLKVFKQVRKCRHKTSIVPSLAEADVFTIQWYPTHRRKLLVIIASRSTQPVGLFQVPTLKVAFSAPRLPKHEGIGRPIASSTNRFVIAHFAPVPHHKPQVLSCSCIGPQLRTACKGVEWQKKIDNMVTNMVHIIYIYIILESF